MVIYHSYISVYFVCMHLLYTSRVSVLCVRIFVYRFYVYASVVYQSYISFICTHLSYIYQFYVYASVVYQSYTSLMCGHLSYTSLYQLYLYLEKYRYYQTGIINYMFIYIKYYYEVGDKVRRGGGIKFTTV